MKTTSAKFLKIAVIFLLCTIEILHKLQGMILIISLIKNKIGARILNIIEEIRGSGLGLLMRILNEHLHLKSDLVVMTMS